MSKMIATREAYGVALKELGERNKDVVVLDADLSKSTKTNVFGKAIPDRFINVGIAEQNLMGVAAGLAAAGKIPFASTFAMFAAGRAFEQVRNSICYPRLNVKIAATHAGITVGEDGATHQALEDLCLMRSLPNMTVIVPADAAETRRVVDFAAEYDGPVYIRLGRAGVPELFGESYEFQLGKAVQLADGKDVTIIACGLMVSPARTAAEWLIEAGYSARVLNMATIKPLDIESIVAAVRDTGAVVTCEEHSIIGGLGGAVAEAMAEHAPAPLERVGVKDTFGESGTPAALLQKYHLTVDDIVAAVKRAVIRKKG
ncbi:MAG TPA: transketolase family protein [Methylomusa anaerophila]|uniref:1-deoxy-D-xylulose-5-phosphate synthase n=2 Tax=Methylomusa anaerophila TaxID=1930071 RepID=A0A348AKY6_9FIRM|nr:transketolase family protein [Methylomusa anaerophila]BBB91734.1 1-deoxy-D-xylulose-5-phosphate synthase [Methylomusa anaerophila]HML88529.1 transketolase family protein [Methylomusa anaerophila]